MGGHWRRRKTSGPESKLIPAMGANPIGTHGGFFLERNYVTATKRCETIPAADIILRHSQNAFP